MQKSARKSTIHLILRIISVFCFIFAIIVSPVASLFTQRGIQGETYAKPIHAESTATLNSEDKIQNGAESVSDAEVSENKSEEDQNASDNEELMHSEPETFEPKLSESYMLRELFSSVNFDSGNVSAGPSASDKSAPNTTATNDSEKPAPVSASSESVPKIEENAPQSENSGESKPVSSDESSSVEKSGGNEGRLPSKTESVSADIPPANGETRGSIKTVNVLNHVTGAVAAYDLDEYIAMVIVSEMPSYAGDEALKAQAIASRTFVVNRKVVSPTHKDADVCTNPGHCQAYSSKESFIAKYGASGENYYNRAYSAAKATSGIIVKYDGLPITAAYHASSGGSTLASAEVWGGNLPYLVPVYSPEQDDPEMLELISAHKTFTKEEFISKLTGAGYSGAEQYYSASFESFVGPVVKTPAGKVDYVMIAGENISGQQLKNIFSLRSTCFTLKYDNDNITFISIGYGHGVGMSQLGACTMAKQGYNYEEILTHYYTGAELAVW